MSAASERIGTPLQRGGSWLYGRWIDLFVGCGLSYLISLPLLFLLGVWTGADKWPNAYVLVFALLINGPHYGATILRVFDAREDRRKYQIFTVYVTLGMLLLFAAASYNLLLASIVITVYLTWSPWHFSGQNYGLALMFLRRRGIDVNPLTKRLIYASFVLSAALAILAIHNGYEGFVFAPDTLHVANTPSILAFGPPAPVGRVLFALLLAGYAGCLGTALWRLTRHASLRELTPALLLVLTQALWFTIPAFGWNATRSGTLVFSAIWISTWHSLQYLWVTTYYARASGRGETVKRFLLKAMVAGMAIQALPGLIMSPQWLGRVPWDAGLAATLFSVLNLHHFVLDGAIWKLRDGRVARVLLRAPDADAAAALGATAHRPWARALVWTIATIAVIVPVADAIVRTTFTTGSPEQLKRPVQILRWIGRETTEVHYWIGAAYSRDRNHQAAISQYQRSIELFPTGRVWMAIGGEYRALRQWEPARDAFDAAIALNPEIAAAHFGRAEALLALSPAADDTASRDAAITSLERALELRPGFPKAALTLAQIYVGMGQREQAIGTLERALAANDAAGGQSQLRNELARLRS